MCPSGPRRPLNPQTIITYPFQRKSQTLVLVLSSKVIRTGRRAASELYLNKLFIISQSHRLYLKIIVIFIINKFYIISKSWLISKNNYHIHYSHVCSRLVSRQRLNSDLTPRIKLASRFDILGSNPPL